MSGFKAALLYALLIVLGVLMFVYGEYDDSPGGQLLGVIVATVGAIRVVKLCRRKNSTK
ncbi:MAG: hypothetical protein R3B52_00865 [Candidatus Paceibacterota bacterium]